jgi:predicted ATP-grasp superfamily ATP-dependent carboligase
MTKGVIIFSGYNPRGIVAFMRTLVKYNVPFGVIAKSPDDEIFQTIYKEHVAAIRTLKQLDICELTDCIQAVKKKIGAKKYIIAPSTECLNRHILEHRIEFEALECVVPLVDQKLYETISDKRSFEELCEQHGVQVPVKYKAIDEAKYPFVAKPNTYFSSDGGIYAPSLIFNENDKQKFIVNHPVKDFYFQEYVTGISHYLLYYFMRDGKVYKLSQQNYIQQPFGKSMIAARSTQFYNHEESSRYEELFRSQNFRGLVMVEVKEQDDRLYMIEANPRFWGPSQLFVDAERNLFEAFLYDWGLLTESPSYADETKEVDYFWFGGFIEALSSKNKVAYHTYSADEYAEDLSTWLLSEIYNRDDTRQLFNKEIGA